MFSRYVLVGICNTLLTTIIIFGLTASQFNVYIANAIGYAAGILCSFLLNSIFTFSRPANAANFSRFLAVSLICYILNMKMIYIVLMIFPSRLYLSQLLGMIIYTITGFYLNKHWALKK
ncbi:GtrA family protein [Rodentibacter haemolyticus]|uniref:GtrA family protein n=1 Tax=Rodentibacter haemolyticus TaxID=2778911 RepID=A0ABX6UYW6_9PAST|nr:GtrA family protein [Rodentibacter haemolyticus]QPB42480.1 GtrA family protein [Rodentibacter haemolyticus]